MTLCCWSFDGDIWARGESGIRDSIAINFGLGGRCSVGLDVEYVGDVEGMLGLQVHYVGYCVGNKRDEVAQLVAGAGVTGGVWTARFV